MASPREFDRRLTRIAKNVTLNAERTTRRAAVVADQVVVLATPVDTGRARSNWFAHLNSPSNETTETTDPSGDSAMAQARSVISRFKSGISRAIHITNNLPYIRALDDGSSAQAPAGMSRKAIQAANDVVRKAKLLD